MKYSIKPKVLTFRGNQNSLVADVYPSDNILGAFITSAIHSKDIADWFLEAIDDVLSGRSDYEERDGEIYGIEIRKDKTRVYDIFSEEEEKVIECYIETVELKKLILAWIEELEKNKIIR
jgi:hypothetical protein